MTTPNDLIKEIMQGKRDLRDEAIGSQKCALCGAAAVEFKDELSCKEFYISGICQECQDKVFEGEEE